MVVNKLFDAQLQRSTALTHADYDSNHLVYNKQLLREVEHDIMNYQNRGLCYQARGFDNS